MMSLPPREAWIEMYYIGNAGLMSFVAPPAGSVD